MSKKRNVKGYVLNADINLALNILRKSKVVDLDVLDNKGDVDTPVRIRVSSILETLKLSVMTINEDPVLKAEIFKREMFT